jgi:mannosyl-3-phosphoglycerate phosphatase
LNQYKSKYRFVGFSDINIDELMSLTGLSDQQAVSSKNRMFSEPLLWLEDDSNIDQFCREMKNHFMRVIRGGRFIHVIGMTDKGKAQGWIKTAYETLYNERYKIMALGDAENDLDMILDSDFPVQIRSLQHEFPSIPEDKNVYRTSAVGPAGWHEAVTRQLQNVGLPGG